MAWTYGKEIWDYLLARVGNEYGVAGIMGNLQAESALLPYRKQGDYDSPNYPASHQYTNEVNNGTRTESQFVNDSIGYGLAQWTFYTRKQRLFNRTVFQGISVGDLDAQLAYLYWELTYSYPGVLLVCKNATSIRQASDIVLHEFEKPKDQSEAVEELREALSQEVYDRYHGSEPPTPPHPPRPPEPPVPTPGPIDNPGYLCAIIAAISDDL